MSGYCDTGSVWRQMSPPNTMRIAITVANIGRFMKKYNCKLSKNEWLGF